MGSDISVPVAAEIPCSFERQCTWPQRATREKVTDAYDLGTFCNVHRGYLFSVLVDLVCAGRLAAVQASSNDSVTAVLTGAAPDTPTMLLLPNTGVPATHRARVAKFDWAARVLVPCTPQAAVDRLMVHCVPSTRVFVLSAGIPGTPLGPWLQPEYTRLVKGDYTLTTIDTGQPQQRGLDWTGSLRKSLMAQPLCVLFEQVAMPDPRLPNGGVQSLWDWLHSPAPAVDVWSAEAAGLKSQLN